MMKLISLLVLASTTLPAASPGRLGGAVLTPSARPVPGAYVILRRLAASTASAYYAPVASDQNSALAVTDAQGRFALALPVGTWEMCVQTTNATHADPCEWAEHTPKTYIDEGSDMGVEIRVEPTAPVEIEVEDEAGILSTHLAAGDTATTIDRTASANRKDKVSLNFGVWTRRGFRPASLPVARGGKLVYTFHGPPNRDIALRALGEGFEVEDEAGRKLKHVEQAIMVRSEAGKAKIVKLKVKRKE